MVESLGWLATAVFVGSYLCTRADALKRVQMIGALLWVVYGLLISATPVVAANLLVFGAAGWALLTRGSGLGLPAGARSAEAGARDSGSVGPRGDSGKSKRLVASE
jgi:hypothetical protein